MSSLKMFEKIMFLKVTI